MDKFDWLKNLMQDDGDDTSDEKTASTQEDVNIDGLAESLEKLAENLETVSTSSESLDKTEFPSEEIDGDEDEEVDKKAEEEVKKVLIDKALTEPDVRDKLLQARQAKGGE